MSYTESNTMDRITFRSTNTQSAITIAKAHFQDRPFYLAKQVPIEPVVRFNLVGEVGWAEWTYEFTFEAE